MLLVSNSLLNSEHYSTVNNPTLDTIVVSDARFVESVILSGIMYFLQTKTAFEDQMKVSNSKRRVGRFGCEHHK